MSVNSLAETGFVSSDNCREQGWVLKNSLATISQKLLRVRKLYKRFFRVSWTFSITPISAFLRKCEFFNSHRDYHQLSFGAPAFIRSHRFLRGCNIAFSPGFPVAGNRKWRGKI